METVLFHGNGRRDLLAMIGREKRRQSKLLQLYYYGNYKVCSGEKGREPMPFSTEQGYHTSKLIGRVYCIRHVQRPVATTDSGSRF